MLCRRSESIQAVSSDTVLNWLFAGLRASHPPARPLEEAVYKLYLQSKMTANLLDFDLCAGIFQNFLDLGGFVFGNVFLDDAVGFNQFLGFFQAKT